MWNFLRTQTVLPQRTAAIELPVVVDRDLEYILGPGLFEPLKEAIAIVTEAAIEGLESAQRL